MEIDAYTLAFIGGGFTVIGAVIGALSAYWLATHLEKLKGHWAACAQLRAAFAPALAMIYLARQHGTNDRPDDVKFIKSELLRQAAAVEEFRVFIPESKREEYQSAWENYRKDACQNVYDRTGDEWARQDEEGREVASGEIIEEKIYVLLRFAET